MFDAMLKRYLEFREKEKEELKKLNEENEKEDSFLPGLNRITVMNDNNFARATMMYEAVKREKLIPEKEDEPEDEEEQLLLGDDKKTV